MLKTEEKFKVNYSDFVLLDAGILLVSSKNEMNQKNGNGASSFTSPILRTRKTTFDLNKQLAPNPKSTFLIRVSGKSMVGAGISSGDLLIADSSIEPQNGMIVVASINNELTVKKYSSFSDSISLLAENPDYEDIKINPEDNLSIWGVVRSVIKAV